MHQCKVVCKVYNAYFRSWTFCTCRKHYRFCQKSFLQNKIYGIIKTLSRTASIMTVITVMAKFQSAEWLSISDIHEQQTCTRSGSILRMSRKRCPSILVVLRYLANLRHTLKGYLDTSSLHRAQSLLYYSTKCIALQYVKAVSPCDCVNSKEAHKLVYGAIAQDIGQARSLRLRSFSWEATSSWALIREWGLKRTAVSRHAEEHGILGPVQQCNTVNAAQHAQTLEAEGRHHIRSRRMRKALQHIRLSLLLGLSS